MPAIGVHHTETQEGAWDGPRNVARLRSDESQGYYARMFAWRDPDGDPGSKSTYKFPHHAVSGSGDPGAAVVRGCQAGIAVLNGSRGGAQIPDADRRGVYRHLAAHLRDADVEPAELREIPRFAALTRNDGDGVERRTVTARELRVVDGDAGPVIEGYAAVFGQWSEDLGGFREMVRPGAFAKTIQEADVRALWNHDPNYVLGRVRSGTLELAEDDVGLRFSVSPPDTSWAQDLMITMRRGDVSQMSFGFEKVRDVWDKDGEELTRTLVEVHLYDVSPVTFPAYPQTSAEVRAKVASMQEADAPGQEPHPEVSQGDEGDSARARLDVRRRRLELSEVETHIFGGDE
jgi:HK97 family phage prohead protease